MAELDQISVTLGEIRASQLALSKAFDEEKEAARDSRAVIHRRLDEQVDNLHSLESSMLLTAQTTKQIGDEVTSLKTQIATEIRPPIEDWKKIKNMGLGMVTLAGLGGAALATTLLTLFTNFGSAVSALLRRI